MKAYPVNRKWNGIKLLSRFIELIIQTVSEVTAYFARFENMCTGTKTFEDSFNQISQKSEKYFSGQLKVHHLLQNTSANDQHMQCISADTLYYGYG